MYGFEPESYSPVRVTTPMMKIKMNASIDVHRFIPGIVLLMLSRLDEQLLVHRDPLTPAGRG
jgi:hypothetical protein